MKNFGLFALLAYLFLFGCASVPKSDDSTAQKLAKARDDAQILDRALKRCQDRLPESATWPTMFSMGFYGDFWVKPPMDGKIFELNKVSSPNEEQMFIIPRATKDDKIVLEGDGLHLIDAGVYAIVLYRPPQDVEARKQQQVAVISSAGTRFVFIFKPKR
jgi:hypothetical protein